MYIPHGRKAKKEIMVYYLFGDVPDEDEITGPSSVFDGDNG